MGIEFPETAAVEWKIVADAAQAEERLRRKLAQDTQVERELDKLRIKHFAALAFQAEVEAENTPVLEMTTLADYKSSGVAGPSDLIEGVLADNSMCLMLGPSRSGKSTSALQMVNSLLTGEDWLGQKVQQLDAAGLLSYDMHGSLMMDWMSGFPNLDQSKASVVNAFKMGNPLAVPEMRAKIARHWRSMNVGVVVVDSFSASFFGHDQNDAATVMAHYRDLGQFALTEVGARALIVIVHSTDGSPHKPRGSTVHIDASDSMIAQIVKPSGSREISMIKYREHRGANGQMTTPMSPIMITKPDSVTHLVDLDVGEMAMSGMQLPTSAAVQAFKDETALPETMETPDTDSDSGLEDDDL